MGDEERHPPEKDQTATKRVSRERSEREWDSKDEGSKGDKAGGRRGGPYGNPEVDEEALRKKQEERRRGSE
jgi:hypothetical protein